MANWKYTLNIVTIWKDDSSIHEKGKLIAAKIRQTFPNSWLDWENESYDEELETIVEGFENIIVDGTSPIEEFNNWMEELYSYCDAEVEPFDQWPPNKMAWVKTS